MKGRSKSLWKFITHPKGYVPGISISSWKTASFNLLHLPAAFDLSDMDCAREFPTQFVCAGDSFLYTEKDIFYCSPIGKKSCEKGSFLYQIKYILSQIRPLVFNQWKYRCEGFSD